jgi:hypothetical protein
MTMDSWAPLAGFSLGFFLLMGALWLFLLFLWITVPFSIFAIRSQLKQQLAVLQRIEQSLKEQAPASSLPSSLAGGTSEPPPLPPVGLPRGGE